MSRTTGNPGRIARSASERSAPFIPGIAKSTRTTPIRRSTDIPLRLVVRVDGSATSPDEATLLRSAIQHHFARSAQAERRNLRELFRIGRTSLLIGLAVLAAAFRAGELVTSIGGNHLTRIAAESLVIGGWVAMWRPLEIFLYEWWPIRARARLYDRLSAVRVEIIYAGISPAASVAREMTATAPQSRASEWRPMQSR